MKRNKLVAIFFVFIFCFAVTYFLYPCPNGCPACWLKFNKSTTSIILPVEKGDNNSYMISLKNLRTELEKARIGDRLIVELKLGNTKVINMGTHTPRVTRSGQTKQEKYNSMSKIPCLLPEGMRLMPTSAQLIVRDVTGRFKSTKLVQLK